MLGFTLRGMFAPRDIRHGGGGVSEEEPRVSGLQMGRTCSPHLQVRDVGGGSPAQGPVISSFFCFFFSVLLLLVSYDHNYSLNGLGFSAKYIYFKRERHASTFQK